MLAENEMTLALSGLPRQQGAEACLHRDGHLLHRPGTVHVNEGQPQFPRGPPIVLAHQQVPLDVVAQETGGIACLMTLPGLLAPLVRRPLERLRWHEENRLAGRR